jgi:DNA-binding beta-propeller fold protein YncE
VDLGKDKLYVPSEVYGSIEVFKLRTGEHLSSVKGIVKSPHMLALMPDRNELFVADALDTACDVLDATDLHLIKRIPLEARPDAGVYDPVSRILYLGNGGSPANSETSYVSMISVDRKEVIGRIGLNAATLKGMVIDHQANRLYVNMRDKNRVAVIDLKSNTMAESWSFPGLKSNAAMALDEDNHRLFIGSRNPGALLVVDSNKGQLIATLKTVDVSDDMIFDAAHHRLMVSGADGVDVFAQDSRDSYRLIQHADTLGGKTSVYVPALKQFYVVHTKSAQVPQAGLQVFKVNN